MMFSGRGSDESFHQFYKGFYPCQPLQQTSDPEKTYLRSRTHAKAAVVCQKHIQVQVKEQYDLSEQYTPENLMNEYYDSILLELEQKSVVERNMLQNAKL